jgi:proteasome accessory factor B
MAVKRGQAERMLNLLALLVARNRPLTLKQIRYELGDHYPPNDSAARAAFERDKAELRKLGIPVDLVTLGGAEAGEGAYSIDRRSFELSDLGLTPEERDALQMALATVRLGASAGDEALWKMGGERLLAGRVTSINLQIEDDVLHALADGVMESRTMIFIYNGERREVDPYGMLARSGHWYLIGFDHVRGAQRVFRIDRIEGGIEAGGKNSFERPPDFDPRTAVPTEQDMLAMGGEAPRRATVRVDAPLAERVVGELGEESIVRRGTDGSIDFLVPCANLDAFRSWLLAMVDRAEVLEPADVRAHVVEWLTNVERLG